MCVRDWVQAIRIFPIQWHERSNNGISYFYVIRFINKILRDDTIFFAILDILRYFTIILKTLMII